MENSFAKEKFCDHRSERCSVKRFVWFLVLGILSLNGGQVKEGNCPGRSSNARRAGTDSRALWIKATEFHRGRDLFAILTLQVYLDG